MLAAGHGQHLVEQGPAGLLDAGLAIGDDAGVEQGRRGLVAQPLDVQAAAAGDEVDFLHTPKAGEWITAQGADLRPNRTSDLAELVASDRTRTVVEVLMTWQAPRPGLQPAVRVFLDAGIELLPPWAVKMLDLEPPLLRAALASAAMRAAAPTLRWALYDGSLARRARRRALAPATH